MKKSYKYFLASCAMAALFAGQTISTGFAAPAAPIDVKAPTLSAETDSIFLTWEKPAKYNDIVDYAVYMNGKKLGKASEQKSYAVEQLNNFYKDAANKDAQKITIHHYTINGLTADTAYNFTVRGIDKNGKEGAESKVYTTKTAKAYTKVLNIKNYGAVADGKKVNTKAIQKAIDECPAGGVVVVPAGVFKTGAIWLRGDMTLKVEKGATLLGSENANDYQFTYKHYTYQSDKEKRMHALINYDSTLPGHVAAQNIRIVGEGTIDGNGWTRTPAGDFAKGTRDTVAKLGIVAKSTVERMTKENGIADPKKALKQAYPGRPAIAMLRGVKNVYVAGLTVQNPAGHTLIFGECDGVTVNNNKILTFDANNADGVESVLSQNVNVMNNYLDTGDDGVNYAAAVGQDSKKFKPTSDSWVFNNYFKHGHGAVVCGSHTGAWIQNIKAEDNVINGIDVGFRAKSNPANGGGARNIIFRDNALKNIQSQAFIFTAGYADPNQAMKVKAAGLPQFHDITIQNCTVDGAKVAISIQGNTTAPHYNLNFKNVSFTKAKLNVAKDLVNYKDCTFDIKVDGQKQKIAKTMIKEAPAKAAAKAPAKAPAKK